MREGRAGKAGLRLGRFILMAAAVVALVLGAALPLSAASERAVKTKVPPVYPELAKRMKISGIVKIEATVDPDGKVKAVKTLSGNSTLQNAAEEAVRKWKFVSGEGTDVVDVDVTFAMTGQ